MGILGGVLIHSCKICLRAYRTFLECMTGQHRLRIHSRRCQQFESYKIGFCTIVSCFHAYTGCYVCYVYKRKIFWERTLYLFGDY